MAKTALVDSNYLQQLLHSGVFKQMEYDVPYALVWADGRYQAERIKTAPESSTPAKPLRLPAEIDDLVMVYLVGDLATLRSAALTCRAWLAAARQHIFRYVQIPDDRWCGPLLRAIRSSPVIASCIRTLQIGNPNLMSVKLSSCHSDYAIAFLSGLADSPDALPSLCCLELYFVAEVWDPKIIGKVARFTSVVSLSLIKCGLSADEICALLSAFPGLRHLKVEQCANVFDGRLKKTSLPRLHDPALLSLCIDDRGSMKDGLNTVLDYLLTSRSKRTLSSVKLVLGEDGVAAAGYFLAHMGDVLQHMEIGFWIVVDTVQQLITKALRSIDLRYNTNLRQLTLYDPTSPVTQHFLLDIRSRKIQQVTLRCSPKDVNVQTCASVVSSIFCAPNLQSLDRVRVLFDGEVEPKARAAFEGLEKGILEFGQWDSRA
ncbi:hypothetical protein BXZ70DRAFT_664531 [Cristinia sonorae]|uniref:F-box domain-containing protein n=1 Tax=Cristinia sonorae TaxID=1940300 RepID=A0A8K0UVM9_9AGAR|nr:hypothetical protein BXZ70DRAFT_664531 [Cristinia sonorae]